MGIYFVDLTAPFGYIFIQMQNKGIGYQIKRRRLTLGLDQRTLSAVSGVAVHTLSNIEGGRGNPTVSTLAKVLDALGMELDLRIKT